MPDNLTQHTFCAGPGVARSHKTMGGLLGFLIGQYFKNGIATISITLLALLTPLLLLPCFGIWPAVITLVTLLQDFLDWYYHERLLCIKENSCAVGTVVRSLDENGDGDRKLDLLLAPFTENECYEKMCLHINTNRPLLEKASIFDDPPFHNGTLIEPIDCDPDILTNGEKTSAERIAERNAIVSYINKLRSKDPDDKDAESHIYNNLMVGFMARLLDPTNQNENGESKNFQGHFYRKDASQITEPSLLWDAIPIDYDTDKNWLGDNAFSDIPYDNPYETTYQPRGINPLFRLDRKRLIPYLHCEIDGKRLQLLLNQLMLTLLAFGASYTMACMILSGLGPLGFIIAVGIALIVALIVGLIQHLQDGGIDGGVAEEPDVDLDFDDDNNFGDDGYQMDADLVALYGNWIMDTEHTQKFEIHPVKAYYVMGRNANNQSFETFDGSSDFDDNSYNRLTNSMIDRSARDEICRLINAAEEEEPPIIIEFAPSQILSHGLSSFYAGGRVRI